MFGILRQLYIFGLVLAIGNAAVAESITARIAAPRGVEPGSLIDVRILMSSPRQLGGVDFTIRYNDSLFSFISVEQDTGLNNWELFQTAHDAAKNTVNIFCIADIANGPIMPDSVDFYPKGSIAKFTFFVAPNWLDSSRQVFSFYWGLCGDNAVANKRGDTLIVLNRVRDDDGTLLWVEPDNINYPESNRIPNLGMPDSCLVAADRILFSVDLQFGAAANYAICGDTNADDQINISDVVLLINYVFAGGAEPNPLTVGNTDCNGQVSISDAVLLINFIFAGGAGPCASCP